MVGLAQVFARAGREDEAAAGISRVSLAANGWDARGVRRRRREHGFWRTRDTDRLKRQRGVDIGRSGVLARVLGAPCARDRAVLRWSATARLTGRDELPGAGARRSVERDGRRLPGRGCRCGRRDGGRSPARGGRRSEVAARRVGGHLGAGHRRRLAERLRGLGCAAGRVARLRVSARALLARAVDGWGRCGGHRAGRRRASAAGGVRAVGRRPGLAVHRPPLLGLPCVARRPSGAGDGAVARHRVRGVGPARRTGGWMRNAHGARRGGSPGVGRARRGDGDGEVAGVDRRTR